jgi:hypothetical protein
MYKTYITDVFSVVLGAVQRYGINFNIIFPADYSVPLKVLVYSAMLPQIHNLYSYYLTESNSREIMNDESERISNEVVMANFKALS